MRFLIAFSVVLGIALGASQPHNQDEFVKRQPQRVVGGEATDISQYPFMSNMEFLLNQAVWTQLCGGSLITRFAVLSAAHCFFGEFSFFWRVRLGSTSATSGGSHHSLSRIIFHPLYDNNMLTHDVALLHLLNPPVLSSNIGLASIAGPRFLLKDNAVASVVGWGSLSAGGPSSNTLQHVDVNIINHELCAQRYAYLKTLPGFQNWPEITPDMLCAGILSVGGKGACQGDYGGPLVQNGVIVGITSWGRECADAFYPGVNARVSAMTDFIIPTALSFR